MKLSIPLRLVVAVLIGLCAEVILFFPMSLRAADTPPQVSKDGLQLKTHTKQRLVYLKPGATFNQYDKVLIVDCLS